MATHAESAPRHVRADSRSKVPAEFAQALRELGLAGAGPLTGTPLTGGVSSDIWRIDTDLGPVCAKRALPKLRVAADWHAPIERNRYEARWMQARTCSSSRMRLGSLVSGSCVAW